MSSEHDDDQKWDLTPVIHLIHALSPKSVKNAESLTLKAFDVSTTPQRPVLAPTLGNFDRLWQELGIPLDIPPPKIKPLSIQKGHTPAEADPSPNGDDASPVKGVRWRDEDGIAELEDNDENTDEPPSRRLEKLSKADRRNEKKARKLRLDRSTSDAPLASDLESDTELQRLRGSPKRKSLQGLSSAIHMVNALSDDSGITSTSPPKPSILKARAPLPASKPLLWTRPSYQIEPLNKLSAAERKAKLVIKLVETFPEESGSLLHLAGSPRAKTTVKPSKNDVHVFVDCSNIMIGFLDSLKRARGIPDTARPRRVPMSFHSFALILERGRRAKKRVLVGSKPLTPAVDEAQACGYEISILDRVMKAREVSPRKKKFQNGGNTTSGQSSGSETSAPQRLVEQAVDEILHLKMLESLIDAKEPATMVLATGDAAEAEYSGGFMKMVERALEKGWKVELASFKQNLSWAYRQKPFRQKWTGRFKLIFLDDYSEELLDL